MTNCKNKRGELELSCCTPEHEVGYRALHCMTSINVGLCLRPVSQIYNWKLMVGQVGMNTEILNPVQGAHVRTEGHTHVGSINSNSNLTSFSLLSDVTLATRLAV